MQLIKPFLFTFIVGTLFGCTGPSYNQPVNLTDEAKASLEAKIDKYDAELKTAIEEFEQSKNGDSASENVTGEDGDPLVDLYIKKYRAEKNLGQIDDAISTLEDGLELLGGVSTPMWHNLAKTYESAGDCIMAEKYYKELTEKANLQQYYYDLAHCYFKSTPEPVFAKVEENYLKYLKFSFNPDPEIENYLKANKK